MHVLVTGGTGFLGRALCATLLAQGHAVSVLTRDRARAARLLPPGAAALEALPADAPQAIVNLAGESLGAQRWTEARKRAFVDSRAGTTRALVDWMARLPRKPGVLVSGSAVGYYGARGDEPLDENAPPRDEFQSTLCAQWEAEARKAEGLGVRVCRVRTGIVLGVGGGALAAMKLPFSLGLGGHLGDGRQWMSWIHRDDWVALILWLLADDGRTGAYNATAPNPATNRDFARALGASLHRPAVLPMPAFMVRLLVGEMAHLLLTGQKVVPARAQTEGFAFRYPDLRAALAAVWSVYNARPVPGARSSAG
ncbi:MAG: TIGR01777 family oxidoreductase [Nevskiaceae bacterium]